MCLFHNASFKIPISIYQISIIIIISNMYFWMYSFTLVQFV